MTRCSAEKGEVGYQLMRVSESECSLTSSGLGGHFGSLTWLLFEPLLITSRALLMGLFRSGCLVGSTPSACTPKGCWRVILLNDVRCSTSAASPAVRYRASVRSAACVNAQLALPLHLELCDAEVDTNNSVGHEGTDAVNSRLAVVTLTQSGGGGYRLLAPLGEDPVCAAHQRCSPARHTPAPALPVPSPGTRNSLALSRHCAIS